MKTSIAIALSILVCAVFSTYTFLQQTPKSDFDLSSFGKLPVMQDEEIQSIDTIARRTLFSIHGKSYIRNIDNSKTRPVEWLADCLMRPEKAKTVKLFVIEDENILADLSPSLPSIKPTLFETLRYKATRSTPPRIFSFYELDPFFETITAKSRIAMRTENRKRSSFQNEVIDLSQDLQLFQRLTKTLRLKETGSVIREYKELQNFIPEGMKAFELNKNSKDFDQSTFDKMSQTGIAYQNFEYGSHFRPIPTIYGNTSQWEATGSVLRNIIESTQISPLLLQYAKTVDAYEEQNAKLFNTTISDLNVRLKVLVPKECKSASIQQTLNKLLALKTSIIGYLTALLLASIAWKKRLIFLRPAASTLVITSFAFHSIALISGNHAINGYVNASLYQTTLFVGWAAVVIAMVLSIRFKTIAGVFTAAVIGLVSLLSASDLATQDYSLYMKLSPIALSNSWQIVNSVAHTFSYAATILAGVLATVLSLLKIFSVRLNQGPYLRLMLMSFYSLCLAAISGFVGISSSCIISDIATGLYWNWTPEENSKLILFTYNFAVMLAYLDRQIAARGYIIAVIFGTIIAVWSIIGIQVIETQEIGKSFWYFIAFSAVQLISIIIAMLPRKYWKSRLAL